MLSEITKRYIRRIITTCIKPDKPYPNSCCGCGCGEVCVWTPYYKALKEYEECIKIRDKDNKVKL